MPNHAPHFSSLEDFQNKMDAYGHGTVGRLIARLLQFDPKSTIHFNTKRAGVDQHLLSINTDDSPNNPTLPIPPHEFVEIDIGYDGD